MDDQLYKNYLALQKAHEELRSIEASIASYRKISAKYVTSVDVLKTIDTLESKKSRIIIEIEKLESEKEKLLERK